MWQRSQAWCNKHKGAFRIVLNKDITWKISVKETSGDNYMCGTEGCDTESWDSGLEAVI